MENKDDRSEYLVKSMFENAERISKDISRAKVIHAMPAFPQIIELKVASSFNPRIEVYFDGEQVGQDFTSDSAVVAELLIKILKCFGYKVKSNTSAYSFEHVCILEL